MTSMDQHTHWINPIINAHEIDWPKASTVQKNMSEQSEEFEEYMSAGCTASVPAGARKIYLILVTASMLIGGVFLWAIFQWLDL